MSQATERKAACEAYVAAKLEGRSNKEATAAANKVGKAGHSLLDLSWYAANGKTPTLPDAPFAQTVEAAGEVIVNLQSGKGWKGKFEGERLSWGRISVALGWFNPADPSTAGENAVQRLFPHATKVVLGEALAAEGMRSGHGGRWLADDPRYYTGTHKGNGVEEERPRQIDPTTLNPDAEGKMLAFATGRKAAAAKARAPRKPRTQKPKAS